MEKKVLLSITFKNYLIWQFFFPIGLVSWGRISGSCTKDHQRDSRGSEWEACCGCWDRSQDQLSSWGVSSCSYARLHSILFDCWDEYGECYVPDFAETVLGDLWFVHGKVSDVITRKIKGTVILNFNLLCSSFAQINSGLWMLKSSEDLLTQPT